VLLDTMKMLKPAKFLHMFPNGNGF